MESIYEITAVNENEVWQQVADDLTKETFNYTVVIKKENIPVVIIIDIDPGSGFAGGYAFTNFSGPLTRTDGFKFALHHQGWLDEIGKFFGMQDVEIGDPGFDKKVIVKTNDEAKVKVLLANEKIRQYWQSISSFNLHTSGSEEEETGTRLKLELEEGITNPEELRKLYHSFFDLLRAANNVV